MNVLTFDTGNATQEELTLILNGLDTIVSGIMDDEENEGILFLDKECKECLGSINKARQSNCKYTMYINTHAAQVWANQAVNNTNRENNID